VDAGRRTWSALPAGRSPSLNPPRKRPARQSLMQRRRPIPRYRPPFSLRQAKGSRLRPNCGAHVEWCASPLPILPSGRQQLHVYSGQQRPASRPYRRRRRERARSFRGCRQLRRGERCFDGPLRRTKSFRRHVQYCFSAMLLSAGRQQLPALFAAARAGSANRITNYGDSELTVTVH